MKRSFFVLAALSVISLAFTSCQKEEEIASNIFTATTEEFYPIGTSKTEIDPLGHHKVYWKEGDVVEVIALSLSGSETIGYYTATPDPFNSGNKTNASFTFLRGTDVLSASSSYLYFSIQYPIDLSSDLGYNGLPAVQHSDGNLDHFPMASKPVGMGGTGSHSVYFYNQCGALKFHLTSGDPIRVNKITVTADKALWGTTPGERADSHLSWATVPGTSDDMITITMGGQTMTVPAAVNYYQANVACDNGINNVATLQLDSPINIANGSDIYMYLPEGTFGTFEVNIYGKDNNNNDVVAKVHSENGNVVIERSKITTITLGTSLNPLTNFQTITDNTHPFSVSNSKQVLFSSGNLQHNYYKYINNLTSWRFAPHQYDITGVYISTYTDSYNGDGWLELLGWSTDGYWVKVNEANNTRENHYNTFGSNCAYQRTGTRDSLFSGNFIDWGNVFGGTQVWRTLTSDEWDYLVGNSTSRSDKSATGCIQIAENSYVYGLILLPDSWTLPSGCSFTYGFTNYTTNTYNLTQWSAMEAAGAVFLPAAGYREATTITGSGTHGYYWSSTSNTSTTANAFHFTEGSTPASESHFRYWGCLVRLVKDVN